VSNDDFEPYLSAYIDGELEPARAEAVAAHLGTCPTCTRVHERHLALRAALHEALPPLRAGDRLQRSVRQSLRGATRTRVVPSLREWRWLAAAAVLAMVVVSSTWTLAARRTADQLVPREVLASHVRSLMGTHLLDVASSDQHTVKPWFNGKLDFSPAVSDFAGRGYPLIGGRLDYVGGRSVAALVYGRRQHVINVFLWPAGGGPSRVRTVTQQGYHLFHWKSADSEYWVVSDLGEAELRAFTQLITDGDSATGGMSPTRHAP
jgi:anti-sigma factor RsiW